MIDQAGNYTIVGAIRISDYHPCFALAVASRDGSPGYWMQVISPDSEIVQGFTPLGDVDISDVQHLTTRKVVVGGEYVHAFVEINGGLLIGSARELQIPFNVALNSPLCAAAVKLSLSEHLLDRARAKDLRQELALEIAEAFGETVGDTFVDSAARAQLWSIIEREAVDADALERIRTARSRVTAHVMEDGLVQVDLAAIREGDLRIDFAQVQRMMQGEFSRPGVQPPTSVTNLTGLPSSDAPTFLTVLAALDRSPRQEERVAILLRSLILYPEITKQALQRYRDAAQMAWNFIEVLISGIDSLPGDEDGRVAWVARLMPRLIGDAYPRRRGAILYYTAAHLSDFKPIAAEIRRATDRSGSMEVKVMKNKIEEALQKGQLT